MKEFIEGIIQLEINLSKKLGDFNLFALFQREDLENKFDLIVSQKVNESKKNELLKSVHSEFTKTLPREAILNLSRVIYLDPNDPFVQNINMIVSCSHSNMEVKDSTFNNIRIKHAHIISSKRIIENAQQGL